MDVPTDAGVLVAIDAPSNDVGATPDLPPIVDVRTTPTPLERCPVAPTLAPAAAEPTVASMALSQHECAVYRDGTARCRGLNVYGQVGVGLEDRFVARPTEVVGLRGVRRIATGFGGTTTALLDDGTVRVWGNNQAGQLGSPDARDTCITGPCARTPIALPGLDEVVAIVDNAPVHGALRRDGTVWCWGMSLFGPDVLRVPTVVDDVGDVTALIESFLPMFRRRDGSVLPESTWSRVGTTISNDWTLSPGTGEHLCALVPDGTVRCWGRNTEGQIGDGTWSDPPSERVPVDPGLDCVRSVVRGNNHTCAVRTDGTVWCWGQNIHEETGVPHAGSDACRRSDGTTPCVLRPRRVIGLDHVESVFVGLSRTCALRSDRTVWCWGELYGPSSEHSATPWRSDW